MNLTERRASIVAPAVVGAILTACGTSTTTEGSPAPTTSCTPAVDESFFASAKSPPSFGFPNYTQCKEERFTTAAALAAGCKLPVGSTAPSDGGADADAEAGAAPPEPWASVDFTRSDVFVVQICNGVSVVEVGTEIWQRSRPSCPLGADPCGPFPSYGAFVIPKAATLQRQACETRCTGG